MLLKLFLDKKEAFDESESESEESPEPSDNDSFIDDESDEEESPVKVYYNIFELYLLFNVNIFLTI